jgi:hypothetical protein
MIVTLFPALAVVGFSSLLVALLYVNVLSYADLPTAK